MSYKSNKQNLKVIKPSQYKNFKQKIVSKNQIDTITGKLMINRNTAASVLASQTVPVNTYNGTVHTVTQQNHSNLRSDFNDDRIYVMAKSVVGARAGVVSYTFTLNTPIAGNASAQIRFAGRTYKIGNHSFGWNDNNCDNVASSISFIKNHSTVTQSTWTGDSDYVDWSKNKVPMFAWVKNADHVYPKSEIDTTGGFDGWTTSGSGWELTNKALSMQPGPSEILTSWFGNAWAIDDNPLVAVNNTTYDFDSNKGYWTYYYDGFGGRFEQNMCLCNPVPLYVQDIGGGMTKPVGVSHLTISFRDYYYEAVIRVEKADSAGYKWMVTVAFTSQYSYLAIARAAQKHAFNVLSFNDGKEDCQCLGFVDEVTEVQIDLLGETLDEGTSDFMSTAEKDFNYDMPNIIDNVQGNYVKNIPNNELITLDSYVGYNLIGVKLKYRWLRYFYDIGFDTEHPHDIQTFEERFGSDETEWFPQVEKAWKTNKKFVLPEIWCETNISYQSAGDCQLLDFDIEFEYDEEGVSDIIVKGHYIYIGSDSPASAKMSVYVNCYGIMDDSYTWKDYITAAVVTSYRNGKNVVTCDVPVDYGKSIQLYDLLRFKTINNQFLKKNGRVSLFEVRNIRKVFKNSEYIYQLTCIESSYTEEEPKEDFKMIYYTNYTRMRFDLISQKIHACKKVVANEDQLMFFKVGVNLSPYSVDYTSSVGTVSFLFDIALDITAKTVEDIDISIQMSNGGARVYNCTIYNYGHAKLVNVQYEYVSGATCTGVIINSLTITREWSSTYDFSTNTDYVKEIDWQQYNDDSSEDLRISSEGIAITNQTPFIQLCKNGDFSEGYHVWSVLSSKIQFIIKNGYAHIVSLDASGQPWEYGIQQNFATGQIKKHKYLVYFDRMDSDIDFKFELCGIYQVDGKGIIDVSDVAYEYMAFFPRSTLNAGMSYNITNLQIFDLTEMMQNKYLNLLINGVEERNFSNDEADSRSSFYLAVYSFELGVSAFDYNVEGTGSKDFLFTVAQTGYYDFYDSGSNINIYFMKHHQLYADHKYYLHFDLRANAPNIAKGLSMINITLVDLTAQGLSELNSIDKLYNTDLYRKIYELNNPNLNELIKELKLNDKYYPYSITTNNIIKLDNYEEENDSILLVARLPMWSNKTWWDQPYYQSNFFVDAGYIIRKTNVVEKAKIFGVNSLFGKAAFEALEDREGEALISSNNQLLALAASYNTPNTFELYVVALIRPKAGELSQGIVPFIKSGSSSSTGQYLVNSITTIQLQYYHIKNNTYDQFETLWNDLTSKDLLNNYNGTPYQLPFTYTKAITFDVFSPNRIPKYQYSFVAASNDYEQIFSYNKISTINLQVAASDIVVTDRLVMTFNNATAPSTTRVGLIVMGITYTNYMGADEWFKR